MRKQTVVLKTKVKRSSLLIDFYLACDKLDKKLDDLLKQIMIN